MWHFHIVYLEKRFNRYTRACKVVFHGWLPSFFSLFCEHTNLFSVSEEQWQHTDCLRDFGYCLFWGTCKQMKISIFHSAMKSMISYWTIRNVKTEDCNDILPKNKKHQNWRLKCFIPNAHGYFFYIQKH